MTNFTIICPLCVEFKNLVILPGISVKFLILRILKERDALTFEEYVRVYSVIDLVCFCV
jgi:hypothetical protein